MPPIDKDALLRTLRQAFLTDLSDHLSSLEKGLLALERSADPAERGTLVREVFRAAHGLKGAARAADLPPIEATCHAMESLLGEARDAGRLLAQEDYAALLAGVDALGAAGRALREDASAPLDTGALESARARIEERLGGGGERGTPAPAAPVTDPPLPARPSTSDPAPGSPQETEGGARRSGAGEPERARVVRLPPERLDAIAASGWELLLTARASEQQAGRLDAIVHELRRARRQLREKARAPAPARRTASTPAALRRSPGEERLLQAERDALALRAQLTADARALAVASHHLDDEVRALRLVPWSDATAGLDRAGRDLAAALAKEVELEVEGGALEIDHSVVAALREPLAHLVRNAIDHGIEPPDDRVAAGKPRRGHLTLSATMSGDRVQVRVSDDGRGLHPEELREAAARRGISLPADEARLLEVVFAPGFSTAASVTPISGRGVGLDIVADTVRSLRGAIRVRSEPGRGTSFEIVLPTTLYGVRAVVVRDGGQVLAIPSLDVVRIARVTSDQLRMADHRPVLLLDAPIPVAPLAHVLGFATGPWRVAPRQLALVLSPSISNRPLRGAVLVDEVLAERELALEPIGGAVRGVRFAAGVGLVAKGQLALVLRADEVVAALQGRSAATVATAERAPARRRRILLADDAATTRALERSLLEAAGYDVVTAADGDQALQALQQQGADLIVSDVEMPGRDGFELTRAVRASPRFGSLPVILLTGRESDADRERGLDAGADAYLVKSSFDQRQLLSTVTQLLEGGGHHDPRRDR